MNAALSIACLLCGHELPDGVVERGLQVTVRRDRLEIQYLVGVSADTARRQLRDWGAGVDEQTPVFPAYRRAALPRLRERLVLQIDGAPRPLRAVAAREVRRHHARVECVYEADAPDWDGRLHELELRDGNFPAWPGGRRVAIKVRDGLTLISDAAEVLGRGEPRRPTTPVGREQSRRLRAWVGRPGDRPPRAVWPWLLGAAALLAPLRLACQLAGRL